jgi:hypothetical protein
LPLNKLDNFIKNTEGRILYVSPSDLDSTDSITNQGNSLAQPFKTLQRALLEAARFSYQLGNSNDDVEKTTILLMPGQHTIDNRPGFSVYNNGGTATAVAPGGATSSALTTLTLTLDSNFDLTQEDNILYKFNSVNGGVIVPRGTSIVGLDLRKTKLRPKYVPNPTDPNIANSAIFRITGACYFWQFCLFDGEGTVYTDSADFSVNNQSVSTFSHHKLTCFEYADGVNNVGLYGLTDLDMYYAKLSNAFNSASGREIPEKYPANPFGFEKQRPEWEIVGAFAEDPVTISSIEAGSGGTASSQVTVKTVVPHEFTAGTPIKIKGVSPNDYNISTIVQSISTTDPTVFTYLLPSFRAELTTPGIASGATVTIETDTVSGASPYIFNISLRSVYGMNGMLADGSKASGFRSMVVAQFTGVSLQKDDRAFVKYNPTSRDYKGNDTGKVTGGSLSSQSSSTTLGTVYHLDPLAIYRTGWESSHIKATNDAFIQIVSVFAIGFNKHFDSESGGDLSITNSNSNFGQISINASGFKKEAFSKDNKAFITSIIPPRAIVETEEDIDWISLDVGVTTSIANNSRLYLFGFTAQDDVPPILTQGYRIGAKVNDKLYFVGNGTEYSANILMSDGVTSSAKQYSASAPSSNVFVIGTNTIQTGEKVIILSDDGDLPENIVEDTVYYAIGVGSTQIKLASSASNATTGTAINVYGGTSLKILSRVSDKIAGDIGSPVQYDLTNKQWYINTNANSDIYNALNTLGVAGLTVRTEPSYIKRTEDTRSLDEKLYKIRVVIPKELTNAKNPENGFIIQQSSTTGVRSDTDFNLTTLTSSDYEYKRNPSFIAKCSYSSNTVTVISELPHNLKSNDTIIIRYVTDSQNTTGVGNSGYNGTFTVASVVDDMTFTCTTTRTAGTFTNNTVNRTTLLPRFERNDLQSNLYVYRNEIISEYIENTQDGVYHIYALTADKAVPTEFTNLKYSQNVVDLYPQLDRDNINDAPTSAKSFAKRSFIGEVVTNDLKKSITKEATDTLLTSFGVGLGVSAVNTSSGIATITFLRNHGLAGIVTFSALTAGTGYTPTSGIATYQNVKLLNGSGNWQGATARVGVSSGAVISVDIVSSGSGYSAGDLFFDTSTIGSGSSAKITIATSGITTAIGNVIQFTGAGTTSDGYYRITSVLSKDQIAIAKTSGDPDVITSQYAFVVGPSVKVTAAPYNSTTGITTFTLSAHHGLVAGNRFRAIDSNNNNLGDFIISTRVGINTFTAVTNKSVSSAAHILKHGLSANDAVSDSSAENLAIRGVPFFADETLTAVSFASTTQIIVSSPVGAAATTKRFPLGSYIQIDDEIMRVVSSTLGGGGNNQITVIRGALATLQSTHDDGSLIKKIDPISVEFRRPSIVRASGHTFEYLGYGPGNYSTGLPQVQVTTLSEREEFLVQSQERSGGIVVYNGLNNNGDTFNGNTKTSASSGQIVSYDIPKPTITGQDPSRLSVVYDEVTIKERLVVEGGNSNTVLSQFGGPVTFNKEVKINDSVKVTGQLRITDDTQSTNSTTGALVVSGGVGIAKTLNVGGNTNVTGTLNITGATTLSNTLNVTGTSTFTDKIIPSSGTGSKGIVWASDPGGGTGDTAFIQYYVQSGENTRLHIGIQNDAEDDLYLEATQTTTSGALTVSNALDVTGTTTLNNSVTLVGSDTAATEYFKIKNGSSTDKFTVDSSSGNTIISGTLNVTGVTTVSNTLNVTGNTTITNSDLYITNTSSASGGDIFVNGGTDGIFRIWNTVNSGEIGFNAKNGSGTYNTILQLFNASAQVNGDLNVTGDIAAFFTSDQRLKENIVPIVNPLAKVLSISGNTYDWVQGSGKEGSDVGVIAQELLEVLPEAVTTRETGYMAVRYEKIIPLLIEAIKDLSGKVEDLQQKLNDK